MIKFFFLSIPLLFLLLLITPVLAAIWLDSDNDGLQDKYEQIYQTNTAKPDTDNGGVSDGAEVLLDATDPLNKNDDINLDDDKDTLSNSEEIILGSNPSLADSDTDGLNDYEELIYKTSALAKDTDSDGLSDFKEAKETKTNPALFDTDMDGVSDGAEILLDKTNPFDWQSNIKKDSDNDGLTDSEEARLGTEINQTDTDGDSYSDGQEVKAGYSPLGAGKLVGEVKTIDLDPRISGTVKDNLYQITSSQTSGQNLNLSGSGPKLTELVLFIYDDKEQIKKQLFSTDLSGFWQIKLDNLRPAKYQIYLALLGRNEQVIAKSLKTEVNLEQPVTGVQADPLEDEQKTNNNFYLIIGLGLLFVTGLAITGFYFLKRRRDLKPNQAETGEEGPGASSPKIIKHGPMIKPLSESGGFINKESTAIAPLETPVSASQPEFATGPDMALANAKTITKPINTQDVKAVTPGNLPVANSSGSVSDLKARIK